MDEDNYYQKIIEGGLILFPHPDQEEALGNIPFLKESPDR
ncbi:hypothetical protein SAMN06269250_0594 [Spirosoma fluviale]|uniref:Uncharacterized protein n=1 Tax=Spirosoma fluviale TaxID=1597977 RepID=A0A286F6H1_9BACT|nr:hypothetical protein SAMN06269250_0594 [Spirosoma fluviale]